MKKRETNLLLKSLEHLDEILINKEDRFQKNSAEI